MGPLAVLGLVLALGTLPLYWAGLADWLAPRPRDARGTAALAALRRTPGRDTLQMYQQPGCACCARWAEHLRAAGVVVVAQDVADLPTLRRQMGVADSLAACHTATVGGYVVEGHVPVADLARLLVERPALRGLALPGMPPGSPGMESATRVRFDVRAIDTAGVIHVYARH